MKPRNAPVLFLMLASISLILSNACGAASPAAKPNILFILSDDHAAHALSAYGSRLNQTPNLDRIARNGMLLRAASSTIPSARRAARRFSPASTATRTA